MDRYFEAEDLLVKNSTVQRIGALKVTFTYSTIFEGAALAVQKRMNSLPDPEHQNLAYPKSR